MYQTLFSPPLLEKAMQKHKYDNIFRDAENRNLVVCVARSMIQSQTKKEAIIRFLLSAPFGSSLLNGSFCLLVVKKILRFPTRLFFFCFFFFFFFLVNEDEVGFEGMTTLVYMCFIGTTRDAPIIRMLIENGADTGAKDLVGRKAIHYLVSHIRDEDFVLHLLSNENLQRDPRGTFTSFLFFACCFG